MTPAESAAVVARLSVAYRVEATEAMFDVWADHLADLDVGLAVAATDRLIRTHHEFFPTIARFLDAYEAERRAAEPKWGELELPLPPPRAVDPDAFKAARDAARAALRPPVEAS